MVATKHVRPRTSGKRQLGRPMFGSTGCLVDVLQATARGVDDGPDLIGRQRVAPHDQVNDRVIHHFGESGFDTGLRPVGFPGIVMAGAP